MVFWRCWVLGAFFFSGLVTWVTISLEPPLYGVVRALDRVLLGCVDRLKWVYGRSRFGIGMNKKFNHSRMIGIVRLEVILQ